MMAPLNLLRDETSRSVWAQLFSGSPALLFAVGALGAAFLALPLWWMLDQWSDEQLVLHATLQQEIDLQRRVLKARQAQQSQSRMLNQRQQWMAQWSARAVPAAALLEILAQATPQGMVLTQVRDGSQGIELSAEAANTELVAEWMKRLSEKASNAEGTPAAAVGAPQLLEIQGPSGDAALWRFVVSLPMAVRAQSSL